MKYEQLNASGIYITERNGCKVPRVKSVNTTEGSYTIYVTRRTVGDAFEPNACLLNKKTRCLVELKVFDSYEVYRKCGELTKLMHRVRWYFDGTLKVEDFVQPPPVEGSGC